MTVFDLAVKLGIDTKGYEDSLDKASEKTSSFADKLKKGLATAAKVGAAALGAAATAVGALTKSAIEGYASQEQLVGGVETLFGAGGQSIEEYAKSVGKSVSQVRGEYSKLMSAQETVMKDAKEAYKTAGLSANEYMETVTGFSASLIQSLDGDTQKAASVSNRIITDMADNANKMGTSMESIQYAYSGFAKQNYTMLDNLKLGYGGTKEEMQRLIADAAEMTDVQKKLGITVDESDLSFANIANAISVVQSKMGIMGTTSKEASETIEGSLNAAKGAWQNLITGLGDSNADIGELVENLTDSFVTVFENVRPILTQALEGMGEAIKEIVPIIGELLPELVNELLPNLLDSATSLLLTLTQGIIEILPTVLNSIVSWLIQATPQIIQAGIDLLVSLVEALPTVITTLVDALPALIDSIIDTLMANIDKIIDAGVNLLVALVENTPKIIVELVKAIPKIIEGIVTAIVKLVPKLAEAGLRLIQGLWQGIGDAAAWLWDKISGFFGGILDKIKGFFGIHSPSKVFAGIGGNLALGLGEGFGDEIDGVRKDIMNSMDFGEANMDVVANGKYYGSAAGYGAASFGTVNININGAKYSNERDLARAVAEELQNMTVRRAAVYA